MQEFIDIIKNVLMTHWGSYAYQGMFYLSLIVIFVLERDKIKKHMFATYAFIVMLIIINPITIKILEVFLGEGGYAAYYQRIFSTIPLICIIAYGFVLLLNELDGLKKLILTLVMCFMVIIGGNNIYATDWMQKADNLSKIPLETIEICDYLASVEGDVTVAVPSSMVCDVRQQEATLYMPYGRKSIPEWGKLLDNDVPYVDEVMKNAGANGCNYIVSRNTEAWINAFYDFGSAPVYVSKSYLVYRVEGVDRCVLSYNDLRQVSETLFLDKNNELRYAQYGYASIGYEYDNKGRCICETYLDENGHITNTTNGYAKKRLQYNADYEVEKEMYYDENDEIAILPNGYSGIFKEYNADGKLIKLTYLDASETPILSNRGYASIEYQYNEAGQIYIECYFDANNNPIALENGSFGKKNEYDADGYVCRTTYLDSDGNPMPILGDYAILEVDRDENHRNIYERYYDVNGNPVMLYDIYHGKKYEYDSLGNVSKVSFVDLQGELAEVSFGYATIEYLYDDSGNIVEKNYYDAQGQIVEDKE